MTRQTWVTCGAEFIESDVIRWHEGVYQSSRYDRKHRIKAGERSITAQVLFDPAENNELLELQVLASEGTNPYKTDELIRRARRTVSREDTERLAWSDEGARASVIDSLPEAQQKAMQKAQTNTAKPTAQLSQTKTVSQVSTGAPWRRRRKSAGAYAAKP